jgi:hypothetical protein
MLVNNEMRWRSSMMIATAQTAWSADNASLKAVPFEKT